MGLIESGMKNTEAAQEMRERYMVSPQKTALAITIANREREILKDIDYENGYSLYVGIPFCPSICLYCSFSSYPLKQWKNRVNQYLEALYKEIKEVAAIMESKRQKTGYGLYWRRYTDNAGTGAAESPSGCTDGEFLLRESCRIYD